jgi:hypothetical protein
MTINIGTEPNATTIVKKEGVYQFTAAQ